MNTLPQLFLTALLIFLLAGSLLGIGVGLGLLLRNPRAAAFVQAMNRWVSTRRALRSVEIPRQTGHGGRGLGAVLLIAGGYALSVLVAVPVERIAGALGVDAAATLALIAIEAAKWLMVAGCAISVASGVLLLVFPRAWHSVEALANRWYSSRRITTGGDDMHLPLDQAAAAFPRAAGGLILTLSIASSAACALLLQRVL